MGLGGEINNSVNPMPDNRGRNRRAVHNIPFYKNMPRVMFEIF
jgi:hypothetical protein